jgi:hypothetical protein
MADRVLPVYNCGCRPPGRRPAAVQVVGGERLQYVHFPLNEEIRAIGGYYKVLEEGVLDFEGKKVLFALKGAHVETSCCGAGGMGFISIPGFVVSYKSSTNDNGFPVSEVKRIRDRETQKKLKALVAETYPYVSVVDFD